MQTMPPQATGSVAVSAVRPGLAAKAEPSDAARKAKRLVYQALEDYYDDAGKRYRAPHCDRTIAEELGVAEAVVKQIRETDFGPLSEPDEVRSLRVELSAAQAVVADIQSKFAVLAQRNGWAV